MNHLSKYKIRPNEYFMLMARMEPENNIEMILEGYVASGNPNPFIVIGGYGNKFGAKMFQRYSSRVKFIGGVYNKSELDSLRYFSTAYFHGHSVGGTNPSLLEAMACRSFIISHDNAFNKGVLGDDAIYFLNKRELVERFHSIEQLIAKTGKLLRTGILIRLSASIIGRRSRFSMRRCLSR
ncbi:MAG: glycosyltransferase [Bacteroidota bacterium]